MLCHVMHTVLCVMIALPDMTKKTIIESLHEQLTIILYRNWLFLISWRILTQIKLMICFSLYIVNIKDSFLNQENIELWGLINMHGKQVCMCLRTWRRYQKTNPSA